LLTRTEYKIFPAQKATAQLRTSLSLQPKLPNGDEKGEDDHPSGQREAE
jgi:hypothetical protein